MGTCMSVNGNANFLKKTKHVKPVAVDSPRAGGSTNPRYLRPVTVIKETTGDDDVRSRYEFGRELGRGEFGVTYECTDNNTGEKVACKTISKSRLRTEIDVEDVRREVEIMKRLPSHPNIVKYKAVFEDKEAIYLVMELCEGGELFDRIIAKGHYTERAAALVTKTMVEVVQVMYIYLCICVHIYTASLLDGMYADQTVSDNFL